MNTETTTANTKLIIAVLVRYLLVFILLGILFFATAGTFAYANGWLYLITMMLVMGFGFGLLYRKDKSLLEKRIKTGEKEKPQIAFVILSSLVVIGMYTLPGLDYRFSWSHVPVWVVGVGAALVIVGYFLNLAVMLQNSYASRVVEIQENQKLIDTGLYRLVRHPMYLSMILLYIGTPLVLGSYIGLIPSLLFPFLLAMRILNEEKVLREGLEGYVEYTQRVKYRLIPYVW